MPPSCASLLWQAEGLDFGEVVGRVLGRAECQGRVGRTAEAWRSTPAPTSLGNAAVPGVWLKIGLQSYKHGFLVTPYATANLPLSRVRLAIAHKQAGNHCPAVACGCSTHVSDQSA